MAWLLREDKETCQECLKSTEKLNIPLLKKREHIEQYPCSKHGHPAFLPASLTEWVKFFLIIQPYCTPQTLPIVLVDKICTEYKIPFIEAFEKLTIILRAFCENTNESDGGEGGGGVYEA